MHVKKNVCFIANHDYTAQVVTKELTDFLGAYLNVKSWSLQDLNVPEYFYDADIYIVSSYTALNKVDKYFPKHKKPIIAARALSIQNLDKIIELTPGTKVLIVGNSLETVNLTIDLIKEIGFDHLTFIPYYPTIGTHDSSMSVAVTTGLPHLVPSYISKTIDLGAKGLDLSTYVELILEAGLPNELINNISKYYIKEIFDLSLRRENVAQLNNNLKRRLEVIINTVDEAILAINTDQEIILVNSALENLLGINSFSVVGKKLKDILPQVDLTACLTQSLSVVHSIQQIKNNFYVLSANPIKDEAHLTEGAVVTLKPVGEVQEMETKVRRELKKQGNIAKYSFNDIIGTTEQLERITKLARQFAKTELTVLIQGESGTGKELFAQAVHNASHRKQGPFVAINFAALPENLLESELFGYEEGAFTGAKKGGKPGLFEEAHNGTIFLDEIGDASLDVQKKLLRVLEEREVRRVGGRNLTPVDVRVIAATNQDLESLVEKGLFRNDLFYRLCTLPLGVPSLKERKGDILTLINYFAQKLYQRKLELNLDMRDFLLNYWWPGNIRELENVVKYLCSIVPYNEPATLKHLPIYLAKFQTSVQAPKTSVKKQNSNFSEIIQELVKQNLLDLFILVLQEIKQASLLNKALGRSSLLERLKKHGENNMSDHTLRQILNTLTNMQFVKTGKTKQGTKITPLGKDFLDYAEENTKIKVLNIE